MRLLALIGALSAARVVFLLVIALCVYGCLCDVRKWLKARRELEERFAFTRAERERHERIWCGVRLSATKSRSNVSYEREGWATYSTVDDLIRLSRAGARGGGRDRG